MFVKIGHRGAAGHEPENTLRSFAKALEFGVDMVECDVHVAKTGELVVIHDEYVDRTTNGHGPVSEKTLDEIRVLDAGKGEKMPLLDEVVHLIARKVPLNIELKGGGTGARVADAIEGYRKEGWESSDFIVSSFSEAELSTFAARCPHIRTGFIKEALSDAVLVFVKKIRAYSINLSGAFLTAAVVDRLHTEGFAVFAWTANDLSDIARLKSIGVDGIFSDFPDRL